VSKISAIVKGLGRAFNDNSPTILAASAVAGVAGTAFLTHRATKRADLILAVHFAEGRTEPLTAREIVEMTWQAYIPPTLMAGATIACIIGGTSIGNRRSAALASAYTLAEKSYSEYKDKVVETLGEKKEELLRADIMKDKLERDKPDHQSIIIDGSGDHLCYEQWSGRYFSSTKQKIQQAEIQTNYDILHDGYASLNDFWRNLELAPTNAGEQLGWNTDNKLELEFAAVLSSSGEPCLAVAFRSVPDARYARPFG
jgi:hypothetical protein